VSRVLGLAALLAACGGGDEAARPAPPSKPDARLTALFELIARDAVVAAANARETERMASDGRDHRPQVDSIDLRDADLTVLGSRDLHLDLSSTGPRVIELRYQRGMRDYPSDLVDPQAEAARRAIDDCLAGDAALAAALDRLGTVTMTVRIDHADDPATVRLVGGHGLDACVARRLVILPADGGFLGVVRVYRQ
jgi:hypothetical protein